MVMNKIDIRLKIIQQERIEYNKKWSEIRNKINLEKLTQAEVDQLSEEKNFLEKYLKFLAGYECSILKNTFMSIDLLRKSLLQVHPVYQCGN